MVEKNDNNIIVCTGIALMSFIILAAAWFLGIYIDGQVPAEKIKELISDKSTPSCVVKAIKINVNNGISITHGRLNKIEHNCVKRKEHNERIDFINQSKYKDCLLNNVNSLYLDGEVELTKDKLNEYVNFCETKEIVNK